jgi:hypothetical protein
MIWNSEPWRRQLLAISARLEKRRTQRRWPDASLARLEMDVMLGAYSVRKLLDAQTVLTHAVRDHLLGVRTIPARKDPRGIGPDLMNWEHLERWFQLETMQPATLTVRGLCNQVIHSWVFIPSMGDGGGLSSILVTSDRSRRKVLYDVGVDVLIGVFRDVAESHVTAVEMRRGHDGHWIVEEAR